MSTMIQTSDYRDTIIDLMDLYFSLTHQYKMTLSHKIWSELSDVEEEIDRLRVLLFKSDKIASKYVRNESKDKASVLQSIPALQQTRHKVYHTERKRLS